MVDRPYIDVHNHTRHFSIDGVQTLDGLIEDAKSIGLAGVAVTEHYDKDMVDEFIYSGISTVGQLPEPGEWVFNFPTYINLMDEKIKQLQAAGDAFLLLKGVELGFLPYLAAPYDEYFNPLELDSIVVSVHSMDNRSLYQYPEYYESSKTESYGRYLETLIQAVDSLSCFQVLGHYDYVTRKAPYRDKALRYRDFSDYFDELFKRLISKGKSLEINTRAAYQSDVSDRADLLPDADLIRRYLELGGEFISLASDSHDRGQVGLLFNETTAYLKSLGVCYLTAYIKRQPVMLKITD